MGIRDLLREQNIEFLEEGHHHCRPGWIQLRECPFCGSNNYHLGFNLESNYFHCWRCGSHRLWETFSELEIPTEKVREALLWTSTPERERKREITRTSLIVPQGIGPLLPVHREYLRNRGFDPDLLVRIWKIGGIGIAPRLSWRIFIPIFLHGEPVSWTTRAVGKALPRYLSASSQEEKISHKKTVYGIDFCSSTVVVVEGPCDAWAIGPGAGALFGLTFSTPQLLQLSRFPRRFICLDSEPSSQRIAHKLVECLSVFPGITKNITLDAKDPAEAHPKELRRLRRVVGIQSYE